MSFVYCCESLFGFVDSFRADNLTVLCLYLNLIPQVMAAAGIMIIIYYQSVLVAHDTRKYCGNILTVLHDHSILFSRVRLLLAPNDLVVKSAPRQN